MDINVRVAGAAGQGVETTGALLVESFAKLGLYVFASQSYMSRIRGGLNWFDVRIGDRQLFSGREQADVLVALSAEALEFLGKSAAPGGMTLFDGEGRDGVVGIKFEEVAKELTGAKIMANTVAAGAVFAVLGYEVEALTGQLEERFRRKGPEVVESNAKCARRGAELAGAHGGVVKGPRGAGAPGQVYAGNEAVGLAAAAAGVKFVTSYPMTPSTGVFTFLAKAADEYGIVVEQAEDEIAAINMVCGATYAGVPAMTTTSGGGFALMVEGVALAGMLELPAFILLAQRPGPATGLPTRTGQQDLKFAINAGHGEFAKAVFAPGTPGQAYEVTRRALETAHKYQTPVIVLTDQYLADMQMNSDEHGSEPLDRTARPIDRRLLESPPADYLRYAVTPSGVSPRALPGSGAFVAVDSDEHGEDGHITEDLEARVRLQDKRMAKYRGMTEEALAPERYGPAEAEHVLVCWGSTYGPCREAVDLLNEAGGSAAMVHFAQVWPVNAEAARAAIGKAQCAEARKITVVEGNSTGQLASVLRERGVLGEAELMLRYDGMPFTGEEIMRRSSAPRARS